MEFRVLGTLEVRDDGRPIRLGGPKQRALLAALLLEGNRVVTTDRLLDALWGERPPPTAAATVQVYVSQLRKALGRDRLATRSSGYVLELDPDELDLTHFERLVRRARHTADPAERAGLLREALALWRGAPLGDIAYERAVGAEVERLEAEHLNAVLDRIGAELELGASTDLVPELEQLVADNRLDERPRSELMLALYRSGRQADALALYQETRRVLVDELGLEPSAELQELERRILNHDPALDGRHPTRARPSEEPSGRSERRRVTVLAADLGAADELDPEDVNSLVLRFVGPARAELERFGGSVRPGVGGSVIAIFGAPTAHEDDPERAVRAALALLDLFAQERGLEIRIGVETGSALVELSDDGAIAGRVVAVATRLEAGAAADQVVVGEETRRATAGAIEYRKLRGAAAWQALGARGAIGERPGAARSPFVGREAELERLRGWLESLGGSAQAVTVVGEPGIGKTRLVAELRQTAPVEAEWLLGRSLSYGDGVPFFAFRQVVARAAGILPADDPDAATAKLDRLLAATQAEERGWIARHLRLLIGLASDPVGDRREAFAAWRRFLEGLAGRQRTVLVLEDLHWADDGLLDFVEYLGEWAHGPLGLLCTARPELSERRPAWETATLARLSDDESAALLGSVAPERRAAIVDAAAGNPLFIHEYALTVADANVELSAPTSVQQVIAARLDLLPSAEREVIQRAAVIGKSFSTEVLAALAPEDAGDLDTRLEALERRRFLSRERAGEHAFEHILVRDVAYEQIPRGSRAGYHRAAAAWLGGPTRRSDDRAELLAYHYASALELARAAGLPAEDLVAPAAEALVLAGRRARRLHSYGQAIGYLERALALVPPDAPAAAPILGELGQALQATGRKDEARAALERGLAAADPADGLLTGRLYRLLGGTLTSEYAFAEAEAAYDHAEASLEPLDDARRSEWIQVQIDRLTLLYWEQDPGRMHDRIDRARETVDGWGAPAQRAEFLASQYLVRLVEERYIASDETIEICRRFLAAREALGDPVDVARAQFNLGYGLNTRGEVVESLRLLEAALAAAERTGSAVLRSRCLAYLGIVHRRRGDVEATRDTVERGIVVATELRMPEYVGMARANVAWLAWRRGDTDATVGEGREALALLAQSAILHPWEWLARFPLLAVACAGSDWAEARVQASALLDVRQQPLGRDLEAALAEASEASLRRALGLAEASGRI